MKSEKTIKRELGKVRKVYLSKKLRDAAWRTAFDEGVIQALAWALDVAEPPSRGFELRFSPVADRP